MAASVTLTAPRDAHAAVQALTSGGTTLDLQAPFSDEFEKGANQLTRFNITRDAATAAEADNMILAALFFNGTTFVNFALAAAQSGAAANAILQQVRLGAGGFDGVAFVYFFTQDETSAAAADDTIDGIAPQFSAFLITPQAGASTGFAAGDGITGLDFTGIAGLAGGYTLQAAGPDAGEVALMAPTVAGTMGAIQPLGAFLGAVLESAQVVDLTAAPAEIALTRLPQLGTRFG